MSFSSELFSLGGFHFPAGPPVRIQAMPVVLGDPASLPPALAHWREAFGTLSARGQFETGRIGYLTIDEKMVEAGRSHRRPGVHVDFFCGNQDPYVARSAVTSVEMVMAADVSACRAWRQKFLASPGDDGDCVDLMSELEASGEHLLEAGKLYGMNRLTVHESIPLTRRTFRRFVRLMGDILVEHPKNYTQNPLGVAPPAGVITDTMRRADFMSY